ncbi:Gti1/Pac2 family-domain-containing protein [Ampelomyces quisqualis]|uniref:Gti1/Pac2 family-domain-containing protein n=1 Tax=Ampelomyces quisqualis TaxID=50730 RepID=A0A6A5QLA5_AMPQU|nr:Gti1/Pac2 family-domain-containing protein [Ampelomyces quisqualis]
MLQGIRAPTLTMSPYGHDLSHGSVQKVDGFADTDAWVWPQPSGTHHTPYSSVFDPSMYANFTAQLQPPTSRAPPRHHSVVTPHTHSPATAAPPPRAHGTPNLIKAQPAFKPTWQGFLDTTKDAMTVVEAALQGRLGHISRRPHDKERAEMLTSGTVLVYEENASGIKRWTDAVHWSPSRVMNNCLIYRQLVRALKPEEKKTALNPSCGTKRKRKESTGPTITKNGDNVNTSDDEFENASYDGTLAGDSESTTKVYANFAQSLTPDQQRRFCGSLIDSYEFKEGGLMKKTISVKYQGTHHHVISYYSLEDVVSGKLKRPYQDEKLADLQPRPELLSGWKVSLEDEEGKDLPLVGGYGQYNQSSHLQHHVIDPVTQAVRHGVVQTHAPLHLQVPEYWHGPQVPSFTAQQTSPHGYASPQSANSQYSGQQLPPQAYALPPPPPTYTPQPPAGQQYASPSPPQHYPSSSPQYSAQTATPQSYSTHSQSSRHYSYDQAQTTPASQYPQSSASISYSTSNRPQMTQSPQYAVPPTPVYTVQGATTQHPASNQQHSPSSVQPHDPQRRASAPVSLQNYSLPPYGAPPHPQSYYVADEKYAPNSHY